MIDKLIDKEKLINKELYSGKIEYLLLKIKTGIFIFEVSKFLHVSFYSG